MSRRVIQALLAVAVVALVAAPVASAVTSSVRVQGATHQVLPRTAVGESHAGGTIVDTDGTSFTTETATALGASAAALRRAGVPWDMSVSAYGPFINSIGGLAADPADYSNWWSLVVNGYSSPAGAGSLATVAGDSYVWFQNPDATLGRAASLLVTRVAGGSSRRGFTPGQPVRLAVLGDDLSRPNSQADAARFSASDVQTPSRFSTVTGATLHVGNRVYTDGVSEVVLRDLTPGTHAVWAEKPMDAATVYVRSETTLINVGDRPSLGAVKAWRSGERMVRLRCDLSKSCGLTVVVKKGSRQIGSYSGSRAAGSRTVSVSLRTAASWTSPLTIVITARDTWGRAVVERVVVQGR